MLVIFRASAMPKQHPFDREYREILDCLGRVRPRVDPRREASFVTAYAQVRDCRTRLADFRRRHGATMPETIERETRIWLDCMGKMLRQLRQRRYPEECLPDR